MRRLVTVPVNDLREGDQILDERQNRYVTVVEDPEIVAETIRVVVLYQGNIETLAEPAGAFCCAIRGLM